MTDAIDGTMLRPDRPNQCGAAPSVGVCRVRERPDLTERRASGGWSAFTAEPAAHTRSLEGPPPPPAEGARPLVHCLSVGSTRWTLARGHLHFQELLQHLQPKVNPILNIFF